MRDPRVWKWVCEDGLDPIKAQYQPSAVHFNFENKGFVMFRQATQKMTEIHVCLLKGAMNIEPFIFECMQKMRDAGFEKFIAPIGDWNIPALRLAKRCGYVEEGRISHAYMRNGIPRAMIIMGSA